MCAYATAQLIRLSESLPTIGKAVMFTICIACTAVALLLVAPRKIMPKKWLQNSKLRRRTAIILSSIIGIPVAAWAAIETLSDGVFSYDGWLMALISGPGVLAVLSLKWWDNETSPKARALRLTFVIALIPIGTLICLLVAYALAGFPRV